MKVVGIKLKEPPLFDGTNSERLEDQSDHASGPAQGNGGIG